ncbi:hypothetical protein CHLRE_06g263400v5 [Chlamydomonas reinhardtii]|uniref:Transmembrane protein 242 n=1 Tax=Chlamydomonas reinhardtii TaxID=3055 RepID=A8HX41_CHLRE|nr:uncharacterized protein CHLRE_06g263400v5 [Chlamydomonas reinhardtii]PNW81858.1 hypothetical protein CHLRE_06g263400v5 [Chlamydomonas reinhardtii]|eukprot:XP_001696569.1 predicted protein [Chlamydomonas reinhardtii]
MSSDSDDKKPAKEKTIVEPFHVVAAGSGIICAVALLTGTLTYRAGTKDLVDDGINPSTRLRVIPLAARTLALSTVLTGLLGVGGFYILKEQGFFRTDQAELPSAKEAARMLRDPRAYVRQMLKGERGDGESAA